MSTYTFKKGNDAVLSGTVNESGSAKDITSHSFSFVLYDGSTTVLTKSGAIISEANGTFAITFTDVDLDIPEKKYTFHLDMTDDSGNITTLDGGNFVLLPKDASLSTNDNSATVTVDTATDVDLTVSLNVTNLSGGGTDANAIHDNIAGEIAALTEKVSPVSADLIIIEDSAASNVKKKVQIGNLPTGAGGGASELSDLSDVGVSTPTNRNALMADGNSWESRVLVEADISDFGSYANASHTHTASQVTDLSSATITFTNKSGNVSQWTNDSGYLTSYTVTNSDLSGLNISELTNDSGYITATLTTEQVEDIAGGMFSGNTETFITATYQDADGTVDLVVPVLDEDNMASNSAAHLATQQSIKAYVDANSGGASQLSDLSDVDSTVSSPSDGDILVYRSSGSDWVLETKPAGGSNPAISDITDVTITSVADNEVLAYNTATGEWINQTAAEAGLATAAQGALADSASQATGVEDNADVTDTANVTAAGALMDSELTSIADVKALNQGVSTTDSPTFVGLTASNTVSFLRATNNIMTVGSSSYDTKYITLRDGSNYAARWGLQANSNIGSAGAMLMQSAKPIAFKANDSSGDYDSATAPNLLINDSGNIEVSGTVDGRDLASDGTKLDGIEANADVTDTANVTAAGAVMDSEVTNLAQVKAFNSADYAAASHNHVAANITDFDTEVANNSAVAANTAKVSNATHTGDVTGSTVLTIANDAVDIPMLSATGTPSSSTFLRGDNTWATPAGAGAENEAIIVAIGDETTAITTGTGKRTFRLPFAMTLTEVRASVTTAPTGSAITIDINESGTSVLSTKLTIDATEKTSETAATAAVISDSSLADDAEITIDFDGVGSTIAGAGVKVTLIGTRT